MFMSRVLKLTFCLLSQISVTQ